MDELVRETGSREGRGHAGFASAERMRTAAVLLGLALWGGAVAWAAHRVALPLVAWPDECIYLVGARNLVERGTLQTNFYLTHSILVRGYPHRDVHMPGYILALAPFVARMGARLEAAAALNVLLFVGSLWLVYALARGLLESRARAAAAAALTAVLPPFPGYLYVAYPEIVVTFMFLLGLAWLVNGRGPRHAAVAGVLYAVGGLFRETLLVALPLYLVRLERRERLRAFVPGAAATLLLVVARFARDRAIHPNALYPSILEEARRAESPAAVLGAALQRNVIENVRLTLAADPWRSVEDAMLLFLLALALVAALALPTLSPAARRFGAVALGCVVLLFALMMLFFVVRQRGGVWGGVRTLMAWAPVLLVLAMPLVTRPRWLAVKAALVVVAGLGFVYLDYRHVRFFNRYKASDLEDQERGDRYVSAYIDRHAPRRLVSRSFTYGLSHYPIEVVWSLPRDHRELRALEQALSFDFIVLHERSPLRLALVGNPRYTRVNREDRGAELLIWRRLY